MRTALQTFLVVLVLGAGAPAFGAEPANREQANKLFKAGLALYESRDYKGALSMYERANKLYPSPQIEFNMALAREKMGQPAQAAVHYERFLSKADQLAYPMKVKVVRAKLKALQKKLATVTVSYATKGAAVDMNGKPIGKTPLGHRIYRKPGEFRLTIRKDGYKLFQKSLRLGPGDHEDVKVTLEPMVREEPRGPAVPADDDGAKGPKTIPLVPGGGEQAGVGTKKATSRPLYRKWWFWTAVGVVAAGVTVSVVASQTGGSDRVPRSELPPIKLE